MIHKHTIKVMLEIKIILFYVYKKLLKLGPSCSCLVKCSKFVLILSFLIYKIDVTTIFTHRCIA